MVDVDALWDRHQKERGRASRNELMLHYQPLVQATARRMKKQFPPNVEYEDLVSYGNFGLITAIDRFDPDRGVKFETFAMKRIQGAIYDGVRSMDWVPRTVRADTRRLANLNEELARQDVRVSDDELLSKLGWDEEKLQRVRDRSSMAMSSLDEPLPQSFDGGATLGDMIAAEVASPVDEVEMNALHDSLQDALASLPEKDAAVLALYYIERLKFSEIGALFGVSESRISQIHTAAIDSIRERMMQ